MQASTNELLAILKVKKFLSSGNPNPDEFLNWIRIRLVEKHKDEANVDFILYLERIAVELGEIKELLK